MQIYQSNLQKTNAKYPTSLDFYQVAYNRHLLKTTKELDHYRRLLKGVEGENLVLEYLEKFGLKDWGVALNVWMDHNGPFETDLILFTHHRIYCFEIKNYTGSFTYENGISTINGWELDSNPIEQTRRASVKMKNILRNFHDHVPIEHAVVFTNADNHVQVLSDTADIEIVPRYCLLNYIKDIAKNERASTNTPLNVERILNHFESYEIDNPFSPEPVSEFSMQSARKGIYCRECLSYEVEIKKFEIVCSCGFKESKEEATLRTICDYGVLNFESNLTIRKLFNFLDGQIGEKYLSRILYKYFSATKNGRHTYFNNLTFPYYKHHNNFTI